MSPRREDPDLEWELDNNNYASPNAFQGKGADEDDQSARCTCEWMHPMDGEVRAHWPAELDPYCVVHGEPNDFPKPPRMMGTRNEEEIRSAFVLGWVAHGGGPFDGNEKARAYIESIRSTRTQDKTDCES